MAKKRLEMVFKNQKDKTSKLSLDNPKEDVAEADIKTAMENIVAANIFETADGDLVSVVSARIVSTDVEEIVL
ncbi:DUF2922 domain-containing protein [Proteiniborus sp. MB09-C3]|uniref:DUF2922 domain-containing protein n=1 Tax=Proteiniborus sp. MB09-C3 TaxID=3050072 RepID=UPI0025573EE3|nr:DUF2922 domain-containing protein [Proteiniborus sp. MB09-C3]WIV12060.1 DUF2922 domain-containing protein [Proteiniborus sp. MB09-C3]